MSSRSQRSVQAAEMPSGSFQRIDNAWRFATHMPIEAVRDRIYRDWHRGVEEMQLRINYRMTRRAIEAVLHERSKKYSSAGVSSSPSNGAANTAPPFYRRAA